MLDVDDWVIIGKFGRVHGIKGFITLISFTEPRDNIFKYPHWHAYINEHWQPLRLVEKELTAKHFLVRIEGYTERHQAANLTNIKVGILKKELPSLPPDEYYWHELIGMVVTNLQGIVLGKVIDLLPTGANDVLIVEGKRQHFIPYLPGQFVVKIDKNGKSMTVDWDEDF